MGFRSLEYASPLNVLQVRPMARAKSTYYLQRFFPAVLRRSPIGTHRLCNPFLESSPSSYATRQFTTKKTKPWISNEIPFSCVVISPGLFGDAGTRCEVSVGLEAFSSSHDGIHHGCPDEKSKDCRLGNPRINPGKHVTTTEDVAEFHGFVFCFFPLPTPACGSARAMC